MKLLVWIALVSLGMPSALRGEEGSDLNSLLSEHCFECHGNKKSKAGLNLQQLIEQKPLIKNRTAWEHALELMSQGEMPPEDDSMLSEQDKNTFIELLDHALNDFDYSTIDNPGFEATRRLSKHEYLNTMRDLFGVSKIPDLKFPDEMAGASGFDNSANTLFMQTSLMSRYISAAERVVETLFPEIPVTPDERLMHAQFLTKEARHSGSPVQIAEKVLRTFLFKAYRRPPTTDELKVYLDLFQTVYDSHTTNERYITGIKQCIQAALVSPKFLYRIEASRSSKESYRISDYALASRLSYFLWASMPDAPLMEAASKGNLHQPDVLKREVHRMLEDPKSDTLGNLFAAQWLGFGLIGNRIRLDPIDNPWCTDTLMKAMRDESAMFFVSLLRENRPIDDLIHAPYTFMNEELAKEIYDLDSVQGESMRKVVLKDPNRAGLLTHGSLMAVTSNYKETSPIKRGNWILETLVGKPLPPPPPNAGTLSDEIEEDDTLSFQEKIELHSRKPSCRSCHQKIDPLGFSLENFDYFGRWRGAYRMWKPERENEFAWMMALSARLATEQVFNEHLNALEEEPEDQTWIKDLISRLKQLSLESFKNEIYSNMSIADQHRMIDLLEHMEMEPIDLEPYLVQSVQDGITRLKSIRPSKLQSTIKSLELPNDEHGILMEILHAIKRHSIQSNSLQWVTYEEEHLEYLIMLLEELDLIEWIEEEEAEESEEEHDRFEFVEITGKATLSDGTEFQGPTGLRKMLLDRHRDDIARQLIRKMLSYALGRQLEYYDEKAIETILSNMHSNEATFGELIYGVVNSYPFQFKKNPTENL